MNEACNEAVSVCFSFDGDCVAERHMCRLKKRFAAPISILGGAPELAYFDRVQMNLRKYAGSPHGVRNTPSSRPTKPCGPMS